MKISIVRGAFLDPSEIQNYSPLKGEFDIQAISSKNPVSDKVDIPLKKLWSPSDLPLFLNKILIGHDKLFGLSKVIKASDVVHVSNIYSGFTHQVIMAKRRGEIRKIVATVSETIPNNNLRKRGSMQSIRYVHENIDKYIAVTKKAKDALIKEGVSEGKVEVIRLGVDLHRFKPSQKKDNKRIVRILCVAQLIPEKGILDLVEAFYEIYKNNKNIWLTFVGDGPLKSDLKGYKNISLKTIPYNQIHREYQSSDIYCLPSRVTKNWEEKYAMSLVESMASGLPIITSDSGGSSDICGTSALYIKPGNVIDLQKKLEYLITNPDIRKSMGKASRALAEKECDRIKIAKRIGEVYKSLIYR